MESLTAEKVAHCAAALKAADIIFEIVDKFKSQFFLEDHRKDVPNPLYQQTAKGLLLEFWGSRPVSIITPWGNYYFAGCFHFAGSEEFERKTWNQLTPQLKARLGLNIHKFKSDIKIETIHGDLWAIGTRPDGEISLPFPEERVYSSFISHNAARKEWQALVSLIKKTETTPAV